MTAKANSKIPIIFIISNAKSHVIPSKRLKPSTEQLLYSKIGQNQNKHSKNKNQNKRLKNKNQNKH